MSQHIDAWPGAAHRTARRPGPIVSRFVIHNAVSQSA